MIIAYIDYSFTNFQISNVLTSFLQCIDFVNINKGYYYCYCALFNVHLTFFFIAYVDYISDHKTVCVDINLPKPNINKVTFSYHPINKINFTDFNQDISNAFSNIDNFNLDLLIDHFNSNVSLILDKYAHPKIVTVKPRISNPWFTSNLWSERGIRR